MDLSIIIPVYNAEKYLEKCLLSIQNQLLQNFEVIMVNDGSLDNSEIICRNFAKKDKRFRLLTIENSGPAHARNVGIAAARGEFIGFVDSDDFIEPEMYESLMQYAQSFPVDMVIGGLRYIDENGQIIKEMKMDIPFVKVMNKKEIEENILKKYYGNNNYGVFSLCNKIYKKQFLDKYNFRIDEGRVRAEDYWFNLNVYRAAALIMAVDIYGYNYVQVNRQSVMRAFRANQFELFCKTRTELLELNEDFGFTIDYNAFDAGFIQETVSFIIQMINVQKGVQYSTIKKIITHPCYADAIEKCSDRMFSVQIRVINRCIKNKLYFVAYILFRSWALKYYKMIL